MQGDLNKRQSMIVWQPFTETSERDRATTLNEKMSSNFQGLTAVWLHFLSFPLKTPALIEAVAFIRHLRYALPRKQTILVRFPPTISNFLRLCFDRHLPSICYPANFCLLLCRSPGHVTTRFCNVVEDLRKVEREKKSFFHTVTGY